MAEPTDAPAINAAGTTMSKVVAGGDTLSLTCPEGTTPSLKVGDLLPNATDALFFVSSVKDATFVVGPLKAGVHELAYQCSDNTEYKTSIEVPEQDPKKLPPKEGPLGLIAFSMWWLWALIGLIILAGAVAAFIYQRKKSRIRNAIKLKESLAKPMARDTHQLLRDMIAMLEQIEKSPAAAEQRADEIYQKGYRSVRGFLEKELKLKTQAETTPQFIGSIKIVGAKQKIPSDLIAQIERSLLFSDQNRFGAAMTDNAESRKQYASDLKSILQNLMKQSVQWREQARPATPTKKPGGKKS